MLLGSISIYRDAAIIPHFVVAPDPKIEYNMYRDTSREQGRYKKKAQWTISSRRAREAKTKERSMEGSLYSLYGEPLHIEQERAI